MSAFGGKADIGPDCHSLPRIILPASSLSIEANEQKVQHHACGAFLFKSSRGAWQ